MARLIERFCPRCGKSIGPVVVGYLCRNCDGRLCIDCGEKHPDIGERCIDCNATWVHKTLEEVHNRTKNSKLKF